MTGHATWGFQREFFLLEERRLESTPCYPLFTYVAGLLQAVEAFFASIEQARFENFVIVVCT